MKKHFSKNFTNNDTSELCYGGHFHCPGEGYARIKPQALILTLTNRHNQEQCGCGQDGVHTRTPEWLRVPWRRDPLAPAQRGLALSCVSPVLSSDQLGGPGGGTGYPQRGLSPGSLFTARGGATRAPTRLTAPRHGALHGPVTSWGRARTPSHGAQHSARQPGVGALPSVHPGV